MLASHLLLTTFIAEHAGSSSGSTIKAWMSGIKAWHDLNGAPWEGEDRWVELARRTANKLGTKFKREQRGPVTTEHLIALKCDLDHRSPFDGSVKREVKQEPHAHKLPGKLVQNDHRIRITRTEWVDHVAESGIASQQLSSLSTAAPAPPLPPTTGKLAYQDGLDPADMINEPRTRKAFTNAYHTKVVVPPFDVAVWSLALAAFWGCRRLGELTIPALAKFNPKYHMTRGTQPNRIRSGNTVSATTLHIPWTKSTREQGGRLMLTTRGDDFCPEAAFEKHLRVNANVPDSAPLFAFDAGNGKWSPMTKDHFLRCCMDIWTKAKMARVHGHSFRIGGSTELLLAGVTPEIVASLGGWTSLALNTFYR
ncbi:hypothetical protein C8R45DRAFT_1098240 [Mycena sanguinolenta]|nr:hypothetical protein C8R45DRAFT_1098240 [Mycena sanguinolenta]